MSIVTGEIKKDISCSRCGHHEVEIIINGGFNRYALVKCDYCGLESKNWTYTNNEKELLRRYRAMQLEYVYPSNKCNCGK